MPILSSRRRTRTRKTETPPPIPGSPLIGALLRVPAEIIHRRLIGGLNESGFTELRLPHMAVLQYPGPNGCRPQELARRAGMSKQAINQLLHTLERQGYVTRRDAGDDGRARTVRFTRRGEAVWNRMVEILTETEAEWSRALGKRRFDELKSLLQDLWLAYPAR
jgi:DNA-binding MarR family transcriptional regulator